MRDIANVPRNDHAVSPVVGVMLMLVVVIIIAAIVSGFAGSLVNSNNKVPQATITGTYSQSANILMMYHAGGDELATQNIFVIIREKDEQNGGYQGTMSRSSTNKSEICNAAGTCWITPTGIVKLAVWRPGETMYYNGKSFSTSNIGKSFTLEVDTTDGKLLSKTDVKIGP
ncbi:MAG: type IV pilin [Methanoregula sp.]|jgi:FlaG/FlaF family flagellin (archaellin)